MNNRSLYRLNVRISRTFRLWIGIKSLLDLIEVARQADSTSRVSRFLCQLEEVANMV